MSTRLIVAGAVAVALVVAGLAYALTSDGGDEDDTSAGGTGGAAPSPQATIAPTSAPTQPPVRGATPSPDSPVAATPSAPSGPVPPLMTATPPTTPTLPPDTRAVLAPIDAADVRVAESLPPQYFLHVLAGLPSGCAKQYTHSVSRSGDVFKVTVLNSMPTGNVVCTQIYGTYELNINLGASFQRGVTYTVEVNDKVVRFTAQ